MEYQEDGMAAFIRFGLRTFDETGTPNSFNPTMLDTDQWILGLKQAGFKRVILSAKNRDGFCLWKTKLTQFSVENSVDFQETSQKLGQSGDVVEEVSRSCMKYGMKMGIYLSPWDWHHKEFWNEEVYNQYYMDQLRELLGNPKYGNNGEFCEVYIDGSKVTEKRHKFWFRKWFSLIKKLQPNAVISSPYGSGVRPMQKPSDPCWATISSDIQRGYFDATGNVDYEYMNEGDMNGNIWSIGEVVTSIVSGLYWSEVKVPKSIDELVSFYMSSVAMGHTMLLNVPPSKDGVIEQNYIDRMRKFGSALEKTFAKNLATYAAGSSSVHDHLPANVLTGSSSYWMPNGGENETYIEVRLDKPQSFDIVVIKEQIELGQHVCEFKCEVLIGNFWKVFKSGYSIGAKRILRSYPVTSDRIRITLKRFVGTPMINFIGVYKASDAFSLDGKVPHGLTNVQLSALQLSDSDWETDGEMIKTGTQSATVVHEFVGLKVWITGVIGPDAGEINIYLDDELIKCVDLTASKKMQKTLYVSDDLSDGQHLIKIETLNDKHVTLTGMHILSNRESGMLEFSSRQYDVEEGESVQIIIKRIGSTAKRTSFTLQTVSGTAVPELNYNPVLEDIVFEEGEVIKEVAIPTQRHGTSNDVYFSVEMVDESAAAILGFNYSAKIRIQGSVSWPGKFVDILLSWMFMGSVISVVLIIALFQTESCKKRKSTEELAFLMPSDVPQGFQRADPDVVVSTL